MKILWQHYPWSFRRNEVVSEYLMFDQCNVMLNCNMDEIIKELTNAITHDKSLEQTIAS